MPTNCTAQKCLEESELFETLEPEMNIRTSHEIFEDLWAVNVSGSVCTWKVTALVVLYLHLETYLAGVCIWQVAKQFSVHALCDGNKKLCMVHENVNRLPC